MEKRLPILIGHFFCQSQGCFSFQQCHGWNWVVLQFLAKFKLNTLLKSVPLATKKQKPVCEWQTCRYLFDTLNAVVALGKGCEKSLDWSSHQKRLAFGYSVPCLPPEQPSPITCVHADPGKKTFSFGLRVVAGNFIGSSNDWLDLDKESDWMVAARGKNIGFSVEMKNPAACLVLLTWRRTTECGTSIFLHTRIPAHAST